VRPGVRTVIGQTKTEVEGQDGKKGSLAAGHRVAPASN
jgi:hypothetical protein